MTIPASYDFINEYNWHQEPSHIHVKNTELANYYKRYLFKRAISVFDFDIPETWDKTYFTYTLFGYGHLAVIKTDKYGVIPQQCQLMGYNVFYQPTNVTISNPLLRGILNPKIGTQCELVKLQPDYRGILDIVDIYGDMLALALETAAINLNNSKMPVIFQVQDKAAAESYKKMYDEVNSGEPAVFINKNLTGDNGEPNWNLFLSDVGQNYITGDILENMRTISAMFDTEIGIKNVNFEKKERLVTNEANANEEETQSLSDLWLETMQTCFEKVNAMFGLECSVKKHFNDEKEEPENDTDLSNRNV